MDVYYAMERCVFLLVCVCVCVCVFFSVCMCVGGGVCVSVSLCLFVRVSFFYLHSYTLNSFLSLETYAIENCAGYEFD